MNWIDGVLIALLLASVIVGSKKGLIRELMAFIVFFTAIIVSVNYIDNFAVWVYTKMGGSPLISALLSFVILIAVSYAVFKILGLLFYRVANIKQVGRRDQMGGALIGFLRGWVAVGFLTLLVFLVPMPDNFYTSFESSFFGPAVAKTIPLMFDGTSKLHPRTPDFMSQMEKTLMAEPGDGGSSMDEDRTDVYRTLYRMEKYFTTGLDGS
jgi:uncharacterized membrane protein required for colicin V production